MITKKLIPLGGALLSAVFLLSAFTRPSLRTDLSQQTRLVRDTVPIVSSDSEHTFEKVEVEASFPGGEAAWHKFLERNLNGDVPVKKKAPAGQYTVILQFVVDKLGNVSAITPLTNIGYGMEEEVIRVLRLSPHWIPAQQSGRKVKAYRKQPVTFWIEEEEKKKKKKKDD